MFKLKTADVVAVMIKDDSTVAATGFGLAVPDKMGTDTSSARGGDVPLI